MSAAALDQMPAPALAKLPNVIATAACRRLERRRRSNTNRLKPVRQVAAIIRGEVPAGAVNAISWSRRPLAKETL